MNLAKKILKYIGNTLLVILFILCLYAVFVSTILKKPYVNMFGYTFFVVASGSMADTINIHDVVIVKINEDYNVNDIITYYSEGYFITHRVMSINGNEIVAKGDANNASDELVKKESVIGKVVLYFSLDKIFKIIGAVILILIIVLVFNFQTVVKSFILKKSRKKIREEGVDDKLFISEFSEILNQRKHSIWIKDTDKSMLQLRYLTKTLELIEVKEYDLLGQLLNSYSFDELKEGIISKDVLINLKEVSLKTYMALMLKCITYEDTEMFDLIFYFYRKKVFKNYLLKKHE